MSVAIFLLLVLVGGLRLVSAPIKENRKCQKILWMTPEGVACESHLHKQEESLPCLR